MLELIALAAALVLLGVSAWENRRSPTTWLYVAFTVWVVAGSVYLAVARWLQHFSVVG